MRPAKVPGEVVYQKVWASLQSRMDPNTRLVRPGWLTMMHEIHVCRQRIADAIKDLKMEGRIEVVTIPNPKRKQSDYYYKIV